MAYEVRNGNRYWYIKVRRGDRVSSVYIGTGLIAELAEQLDFHARHRKSLERADELAAVESIMAADRTMAVYTAGVDAAVRETMEAAGYHRPKRGPWRRRRDRR